MAVNTTKITSGPYVGNNIADTFSYTFKVEDKEQLSVYETTDLGVQTLLTVDTHYTVNNVGGQGGTIIRVAGALPTDYQWFIRSDYKETQLTAFGSQGPFFPDIHEDMADKLTFLIQQIIDKNSRSPSVSDTYTGEIPLILEDPVSGMFLRWNTELNTLENFDMIGYSDTGDSTILSAANSYSDTGDASTLSAANSYSDASDAEERNVSNEKYVDVAGDSMAGALSVIDSLLSTSAMPKLSIVNAIDVAVKQISGVIAPGVGSDYGFITGVVSEILDYGDLT